MTFHAFGQHLPLSWAFSTVGLNFHSQTSTLNTIFNRNAVGEITIEDLLYSFVAHLGGGETLQGHDGGVGPIAQQQLTGLDMTSQCSPVKSCLSKCVHSVYLESEKGAGLKVAATVFKLSQLTFILILSILQADRQNERC